MANPARRLLENVAGDFFVDETCIDCDACRQIAPATFRDHGAAASVYRQPETGEEIKRALMALTACPTASIGTTRNYDARVGVEAFPEVARDGVGVLVLPQVVADAGAELLLADELLEHSQHG